MGLHRWLAAAVTLLLLVTVTVRDGTSTWRHPFLSPEAGSRTKSTASNVSPAMVTELPDSTSLLNVSWLAELFSPNNYNERVAVEITSEVFLGLRPNCSHAWHPQRLLLPPAVPVGNLDFYIVVVDQECNDTTVADLCETLHEQGENVLVAVVGCQSPEQKRGKFYAMSCNFQSSPNWVACAAQVLRHTMASHSLRRIHVIGMKDMRRAVAVASWLSNMSAGDGITIFMGESPGPLHPAWIWPGAKQGKHRKNFSQFCQAQQFVRQMKAFLRNDAPDLLTLGFNDSLMSMSNVEPCDAQDSEWKSRGGLRPVAFSIPVSVAYGFLSLASLFDDNSVTVREGLPWILRALPWSTLGPAQPKVTSFSVPIGRQARRSPTNKSSMMNPAQSLAIVAENDKIFTSVPPPQGLSFYRASAKVTTALSLFPPCFVIPMKNKTLAELPYMASYIRNLQKHFRRVAVLTDAPTTFNNALNHGSKWCLEKNTVIQCLRFLARQTFVSNSAGLLYFHADAFIAPKQFFSTASGLHSANFQSSLKSSLTRNGHCKNVAALDPVLSMSKSWSPLEHILVSRKYAYKDIPADKWSHWSSQLCANLTGCYPLDQRSLWNKAMTTFASGFHGFANDNLSACVHEYVKAASNVRFNNFGDIFFFPSRTLHVVHQLTDVFDGLPVLHEASLGWLAEVSAFLTNIELLQMPGPDKELVQWRSFVHKGCCCCHIGAADIRKYPAGHKIKVSRPHQSPQLLREVELRIDEAFECNSSDHRVGDATAAPIYLERDVSKFDHHAGYLLTPLHWPSKRLVVEQLLSTCATFIEAESSLPLQVVAALSNNVSVRFKSRNRTTRIIAHIPNANSAAFVISLVNPGSVVLLVNTGVAWPVPASVVWGHTQTECWLNDEQNGVAVEVSTSRRLVLLVSIDTSVHWQGSVHINCTNCDAQPSLRCVNPKRAWS